ncbi:Transcriptional regulatory protein SrrA [Thermoflexales bacterium]|nr:Transcriptional regulatory protein SrrA [Thermoflexales bacterium]
MNSRILVADDDEGLRHLLRLILAREGFEVFEAANGEQALALALIVDPAVILLDVMMPGLDGYDVCRRLKSDQRTGNVPVVFVSAAEDVYRRNEAQQLGAAACIQKPIGPRELVARIKLVMNRRNGTVPAA